MRGRLGHMNVCNGSWGYGPTTLGVESHSITWQLTGAESRAQPVSYFNSVPTTDVIFSGDLFNAAPGVEGDPVGGANGVNVVGNVDAFTPTRWNPNGFKSYDNTAYDHSQVIQISWNTPDMMDTGIHTRKVRVHMIQLRQPIGSTALTNFHRCHSVVAIAIDCRR